MISPRRGLILITSFVLGLSACSSDRCKSEPTSFELELILDDAQGASRVSRIEVELSLGDQLYRRSYALENELLDGRTSFAVDLEPRPTTDFELGVRVEAYDDSAASPLAHGIQTFRGTPNGCNRFELELQLGSEPPDGGLPDLARADVDLPDLGPRDLGLDGGVAPDAEPVDVDAGPPDAGGPCAESPDNETLLLYTFDRTVVLTGTISDETGQHPGFVRPADVAITRESGPEGCGEAASFDATAYIEVPDSPDFDLESGSVDFWVKFSPSGRRGIQAFISRDASGTDLSGHLTFYRSCEDRIIVRIQRTGGTDRYRCADAPTPIGTWTHVALELGAPDVELYLDGELSTNTSTLTPLWDCTSPIPCGVPTQRGIAGNDNPWVIGVGAHGSEEGAATPVSLPFDGAIDSFRISSSRRSF